MARLQTRRGRPAAALVETAAILIVFLLVLFGVFEYCRLVWVQNMVENAAREGARFAVVRTTDTNLIADTQAQVNARMSGLQNALLNWNVQVFHADSNGNPVYTYQTDATGPYLTNSSGGKQYLNYDSSKQQYYVTVNGSNLYVTLDSTHMVVNDQSGGQFGAWAQQSNMQGQDVPGNAAFGQYIAVQIDCDYNPIVPTLLMMNQTVHIRTKAFMCSEAN
jgi:Flp pilus assembly protein TadG